MAADLSDESAFWEKRAAAWERSIEALNLFSKDYGVPAMDALGVRAGDRVVDIGCGPGTTAVELAQRSTLYELLQSGELRSVRIGTCRRIPTEAIEEFLATLQSAS